MYPIIMENADAIQTDPSPHASGTLTANAACPSTDHKYKPADINSTSKEPNLKFAVPQFYDENLELWFWQLEFNFVINKVTQSKDKFSCVVSNLLY